MKALCCTVMNPNAPVRTIANTTVTMRSSTSVNPAFLANLARLLNCSCLFMVTPRSWYGTCPRRDLDPKRRPSRLYSR